MSGVDHGAVESLRSEVAALEQLLEVHERATIEQSDRLEEALRVSAARADDMQRREELQSFLAEASSVLASSLDYETTLRNLAHLAVPRIADWCAIDVIDAEGTPRRVVTAHTDPAKEELARQLYERYPPNPNAPTGVPHVIRTGQPELHSEIPEELLRAAAVDDEHWRLISQLQLRSYMVVPLAARGTILGAITLVSAETELHFDQSDLGFATELATRAALAVDNARLYRDAEAARTETLRILESITDAFFALDREWKFTYVNSEAAELLGRTSDQLVGCSIWDEYPDAVGSPFEKAYRAAVQEQRTVEFEEYFAPLGTWFEVRAYPSEGGLSVYFRNVNDRRAAEQALRASEHRFRFLANSIPVQIWTARPDGSLDYVSDRVTEYFGRSSDKVLGDGWQGVIRKDVLEEVGSRWRHSLETGEPYQVEFPLLSADGSYRWHLGRAVAQHDESGAIVRWFGSNTDIHAQKQLDADRERLITLLERSNRELDQFAYVASHDLKAPLRGIANLSQWLEEDLEGEMNPEAKEHLEMMRGRVHRMEGLIDGILEYSRAGRITEKPEQVDTGALVHEVIDLLAPPDHTAITVAETLPTLHTERLPLQQVFMNLIGNAVKYTRREDATVSIDAEAVGAFIEFRVTDNGPGIDPEYHERIFGIFQTLDARDKVEGTGIGLSLVSKIVQQRGGQVRVESEVGAGSSFIFQWPKATSQ